MALIAPIAPSLNGQAVVMGAAAASDTFERRSGKSILLVTNGSGAPINVTFTSYASPDPGEAAANKVVAVAAGATSLIGPFPQQFEDPATGLVTAAFSATTTVTRAVISQT